MVAKLQKKFLEDSYPSANHIHIKGADRRMIYKKPSAISQHLRKLVNQRQAQQLSAWRRPKGNWNPDFSKRIQYVCKYLLECCLFGIFILKFLNKSLLDVLFFIVGFLVK